jgi:DNA-binding NtrC family response regulator
MMIEDMKVLVVDDDPVVLKVMTQIIEQAGYEVYGVTSPLAALEMLKQMKFRIMLTDVNMPDMDGIELMQAAKRYDPMIQVVVITGDSTMKKALSALENGAMDYLLKPVENSEEVVESVRICERRVRRWYQQLSNSNPLQK